MHSRIGIASFVCGISSIVVFIGSLGWIFFSSSADRVGLLFPTYKYLILLLIGLVVIGVVLGFISLFQKARKRLFGMLGLGVNGLFIFGFLLLMLAGPPP